MHAEKRGKRTDHPRSHGGPDSTPLPVARPVHYPSPSPQPRRQLLKTQLVIAIFNACSLKNNLDELNNHIDIIGVTETWLHDELKDHEVSLPGSVLFLQDRPSSKRGGGVALPP